MNINKVKEYGEFVEIAAPVERATAEEYPTVLGGENLVQLRTSC